MTTSQPTSFLSEIVSGAPIPPEKLGYFRGRLSNRFHELVLELFTELERAGKITKAELARRLGRAPEQVTRWLGAPGNWTLDTASDLFLGMGYEPALSVTNLVDQSKAETSVASWGDLPDDSAADLIADASYGMVNILTQKLQQSCQQMYLRNAIAMTAGTSGIATASRQGAQTYLTFADITQWQRSTGWVPAFYPYVSVDGNVPIFQSDPTEIDFAQQYNLNGMNAQRLNWHYLPEGEP
jgi:hypothetical protein